MTPLKIDGTPGVGFGKDSGFRTGAFLTVIPRSAATRNLFESVTAFRRIPKCRSLAALGITQGKRGRDDAGKEGLSGSNDERCVRECS
jgi:hypothetical protein